MEKMVQFWKIHISIHLTSGVESKVLAPTQPIVDAPSTYGSSKLGS
jgi:hypothetical protein